MNISPTTPLSPFCFSYRRGPITTKDQKRHSQERRCTKRYLIFAKAYFEWQEAAGKYLTGTGATRDISARGVFIRSRQSPPLGTDIVVVVTLPSIMGYSSKQSQLGGRGTVTRLIQDQGFVVKVTFRILRAYGPCMGSELKLIG